jgi:hypothetical protein
LYGAALLAQTAAIILSKTTDAGEPEDTESGQTNGDIERQLAAAEINKNPDCGSESMRVIVAQRGWRWPSRCSFCSRTHPTTQRTSADLSRVGA